MAKNADEDTLAVDHEEIELGGLTESRRSVKEGAEQHLEHEDNVDASQFIPEYLS